jgi:type IV pilus assembly protein PilA
MMVVAIIGILATVGVVGYKKVIAQSKTAEAHQMIGAIKVAHEAWRAEVGVYKPMANQLFASGNVVPSDSSGTYLKKYKWDPSNPTWGPLNVQAGGFLTFGYSTVTGKAGDAAPVCNGFCGGMDFSGIKTTCMDLGPWFVVGARADLDGLATYGTYLFGTSCHNEIFAGPSNNE